MLKNKNNIKNTVAHLVTHLQKYTITSFFFSEKERTKHFSPQDQILNWTCQATFPIKNAPEVL